MNDMLQGGVLDAMADARLGALLGALHAAPERPWTLDLMATASHISRSAFALRFHRAVGVPLLQYLTGWPQLPNDSSCAHQTRNRRCQQC